MEPIKMATAAECEPSLPLSWKPPLRQNIWESVPTAEQLDNPEDIFALVWKTNQAMSELGLSDVTVHHYTNEGLTIILNRHYDAGTDRFSEESSSDSKATRFVSRSILI